MMTKPMQWRLADDPSAEPPAPHVEYIQNATAALGHVFGMVPDELKLSVKVSFLMSTLTSYTSDPKEAWSELKKIIDGEMPAAMALLKGRQN